VVGRLGGHGFFGFKTAGRADTEARRLPDAPWGDGRAEHGPAVWAALTGARTPLDYVRAATPFLGGGPSEDSRPLLPAGLDTC